MLFNLNILAETKIYSWLWLIGLTVGTLAVIGIAIYILKKFRSWLKSDIQSSVAKGNAFDLQDIQQMRDKGQISNEEYSQLKEAYINSK